MWKYLPCFSCQNILMPQAGRFGKQHKKYSIGLLCHRTSFRIQQFRMRVDHPGSKLGRRKSKWSYPIMYYSNSSLIIRRYYWNLLWFSLLISASKCELTSLSLLMICLPVNCDIAEFFFLFHFMNDINVSQKYVPPNTFPKQNILEMKNRDIRDIETW